MSILYDIQINDEVLRFEPRLLIIDNTIGYANNDAALTKRMEVFTCIVLDVGNLVWGPKTVPHSTNRSEKLVHLLFHLDLIRSCTKIVSREEDSGMIKSFYGSNGTP